MKNLVNTDFLYIYIYIYGSIKNIIARNCNSFNMLKKRNLKFGCTLLTAVL